MTAPAPTRSTGSATIGWGVVSIPVSFYTATESKGVSRKEFTPEGNPVGRQPYDKVTGKTVDYDTVIKKYETADGVLVDLSNDEITSVVQPIAGAMAVEGFLPAAVLGDGTYVVSGMLQVRPSLRKTGKDKTPDPAAEKAFALLTGAMAKEKVVALVSTALRGKPQYGLLTPDGRLYHVLFDDEVREDLPVPSPEVSKAELDMGRKLIQFGLLDAPPVLENTTVAKVEAYAVAKSTGEAPQIEVVDTPQVDDLMAALEASLEKVS